MGIRGLLLDVDNTMSTHHGMQPVPGLAAWIGAMQAAGIQLLIVSNAFAKRVSPFAEQVGLPFQAVSTKPLPHAYFRAAHRLGLRRKELAIVGDQFFTDIIGGKLAGVKTILTTPVAPDKFIHRRALEARLFPDRPKRASVCKEES